MWLPGVLLSPVLGIGFLLVLLAGAFEAAVVVGGLFALALGGWLHSRRYYRTQPDGSIEHWELATYRRVPEIDRLLSAGWRQKHY